MRARTGYLPESPPLYPEMDVSGYLRYVAALRDVPRSKRRAAVERLPTHLRSLIDAKQLEAAADYHAFVDIVEREAANWSPSEQ